MELDTGDARPCTKQSKIVCDRKTANSGQQTPESTPKSQSLATVVMCTVTLMVYHVAYAQFILHMQLQVPPAGGRAQLHCPVKLQRPLWAPPQTDFVMPGAAVSQQLDLIAVPLWQRQSTRLYQLPLTAVVHRLPWPLAGCIV